MNVGERCAGACRALLCCAALGLAPAQALALHIEVFTDQAHPVTRLGAFDGDEVTVYWIDGIARAQASLAKDLPNDERAAARIAGERLDAGREAYTEPMMQAAQGLAKAVLTYQLDRYPAVVFDGETVLYGVTDLGVARRLYEQHHP